MSCATLALKILTLSCGVPVRFYISAKKNGVEEQKWGRVFTFDNLAFVRPNVTLDISWRQINGDLSLL
jgi:hypothetical protein